MPFRCAVNIILRVGLLEQRPIRDVRIAARAAAVAWRHGELDTLDGGVLVRHLRACDEGHSLIPAPLPVAVSAISTSSVRSEASDATIAA
jgi:hypothetical protein